MSRSGWLLAVAALALCAAWAVYAQDTGPSATGAPSATAQSVEGTTPACEPAGCSGDCTACPGCADKHNDGVCDMAGTCAGHANGEGREHKGCGGHRSND